jgi:F-type H+-transporting ATPase subunit a
MRARSSTARRQDIGNMLGKNLPLSAFIDSTAGTPIGAIHVDTIALSAVCMLGILGYTSMVSRNLVLDGPGNKNQAVLEGVYNFIDDLAKGQIGPHYKTFFPLIAAIFIFVLMGNFVGVAPWKVFEFLPGWPHIEGGKEAFEVASPTTDFNVTLALATIAWFTYLGSGFWKHGVGFAKTLFFSPMAPIEILDMIIRPSTLALRLMVVITADELMRAAILLIFPFFIPAGIMGFELFIGVVQAFVFALLTSIYIGLTVSEHH